MKWNKRAGFIALASVVTGTLAGVAIFDPTDGLQIRAAGTDLLGAMRARSPGNRGEGAVTTKGERQAIAPIAASAPVSQVLPVASAPAAAPLASPPLAAATIPPAAVLVPAVLAPAALPLLAAAGPGLGGAAFLPLLPIVAAGGSGGGGLTVTAPPGAPPVAAPPGGGGTPVPAIPEPATWLMMIVGFGLLGSFLRRRNRLLRQSGVRIGSQPIGAACAAS